MATKVTQCQTCSFFFVKTLDDIDLFKREQEGKVHKHETLGYFKGSYLLTNWNYKTRNL